MTGVTRDPIQRSEGQTLAAGAYFKDLITMLQSMCITWTLMSNGKLSVAVPSHHLQGAGAYCGGRPTGRTHSML